MDHTDPRELRRAALMADLEGIDLSTQEQRIVDWLSGWDDYTTDAIHAIFTKLRKAGVPTP